MNKRKKKGARRASQNSSLIPMILIGAGVLLILAVLVWQGVSNSPANTTNQSNIPYPDVRRVSLADSKAALDQQTAVFLDVRDPATYDLAHIPGAINIPANEIDARLNELDPNAWIITYCT